MKEVRLLWPLLLFCAADQAGVTIVTLASAGLSTVCRTCEKAPILSPKCQSIFTHRDRRSHPKQPQRGDISVRNPDNRVPYECSRHDISDRTQSSYTWPSPVVGTAVQIATGRHLIPQ